MIADWRTPDLPGFGLLAAVGILGGIAQIMMTQAFRSAPAAVLAPFEYTAMIWAVLFGYLVFADVPTSAVITDPRSSSTSPTTSRTSAACASSPAWPCSG